MVGIHKKNILKIKGCEDRIRDIVSGSKRKTTRGIPLDLTGENPPIVKDQLPNKRSAGKKGRKAEPPKVDIFDLSGEQASDMLQKMKDLNLLEGEPTSASRKGENVGAKGTDNSDTLNGLLDSLAGINVGSRSPYYKKDDYEKQQAKISEDEQNDCKSLLQQRKMLLDAIKNCDDRAETCISQHPECSQQIKECKESNRELLSSIIDKIKEIKLCKGFLN